MSAITLEKAIEVFVRGFSFTRSFTFPYPIERLNERIWMLRDAPRKSGDYRTEEYVGYGITAAQLDSFARQNARGRYRCCFIRTIDESDVPIRRDFKALGYRLMATEAFMTHSLEHIAPVPEPVSILRVTTLAEAAAMTKVTRSRHILPEHLETDPPPMRQYAARDGEQFVGWVGSVAVENCCWCTSMFVVRAYRRRGIARALMTRMLQEDQAAGASANVLLSSHTGSKLYPTVGYEPIGELLMFSPPSR